MSRQTLPYEDASSGDRALGEAQKILEKFGCESFGTMTDGGRGCTVVQFKHRDRIVSLEASWKGYAAAWLKAHPHMPHKSHRSLADHEQRALNQAKIAVCSILRDWIKGQVTAVECGVMSFEAVFMPHMLLATGERLIDRVKKANMLPGPDDGGKVVNMGNRKS